MNIFANIGKGWLVAALVIGLVVAAGGYQLLTWSSGQAETYNLGVKAYENGDMSQAIQLFDKSIGIYRQETKAVWLHRFIYPKPSKELAAMAYFHKAKAHLQSRQAEIAVECFKESLRLNPGDQLEGLSPEDAQRLRQRAMVVKYDLEMLFKYRPDLAQQQGLGRGQGNGNRQAPGNQPGNQPGKGNKDDI